MTTNELSSQGIKRQIGRRIALARRIASKRQNREITVEALAAKLKMFPPRLWEIEEGITGIDTAELYRIGHALDMPPGWIFGQYEWANCADDPGVTMGDFILAKTINQMEPEARGALRHIVIRLSERGV